jgi:hypothetical protein
LRFSRILLRGLLPVAVGLVALVLLFTGGEAVERVGRYERLREDPTRPLRDVVARIMGAIPRPRLDAALLDSGLPVYDLRIGPRQLARLHEIIDRVQAKGNTYGLVMPGYEKAHFLLDGEWVSIDIRLRGEEANHYVDAYPSLRLKFPPNRLFRGKRQINLIDPYDKYLTGDVTSKWEAGHHGLLTWESGFVVLRVNDEVWGIYLETEQFRRELVERNGRSEGPVFSADGNPFGRTVPGIEKGTLALSRIQECFEPDAPVERCDWGFVRDYFDVDRMAWAAALMGLTGHWGAWLEPNMRFYFDPARGRFEPIPWDYGIWPLDEGRAAERLYSGSPPSDAIIDDGEGLSGLGVTLLRLPEFRRMRNERLWTLIQERLDPMVEHAEGLFASLEPALEHGKRRWGAEAGRERHGGWVGVLRRNAVLHRKLLSEVSLTVAYRQLDSGELAEETGWHVRFENHAKATVEVTKIRFGDAAGSNALSTPVTVPGRWNGEPGTAAVGVAAPEGAVPTGVEAQNVVTGATLSEADVLLEQRPALTIVTTPPVEPRFTLDIPGITVEPERIVRFRAGRVDLHETLEIPEGFTVTFEPGLELRMGPGASLIVHGDLESIGRPERPVRVVSLDPSAAWGTVAVQGRRELPRRVTLVDTVISGGVGGETDRVTYTASLAVHDGIVSLRRVRVIEGGAEDGINLKYATVELSGCRFEDQIGDAVDLDFCRGTVQACGFVGIGGDAIDLSGSAVVIEDNEIVAFGDKGVSVGERSRAVIRHNRIVDGHTGLAVKDDSGAEIADTEIRDQEIGIGIYVKKSSYGPPSARAVRLRIVNVSTPFLEAPGGRLSIDELRRL